jgi:hypothetical protein
MTKKRGIIVADFSEDLSGVKRGLEKLTGFSWQMLVIKNSASTGRKSSIAWSAISRMRKPMVLWCLPMAPPAGDFILWPRQVPLRLVKSTIATFCAN